MHGANTTITQLLKQLSEGCVEEISLNRTTESHIYVSIKKLGRLGSHFSYHHVKSNNPEKQPGEANQLKPFASLLAQAVKLIR
jgi:hypothetical protein